MTLEEAWRARSNEELLAASRRLDEYSEIGQGVILDELRRREASGESTERASGEAPELEGAVQVDRDVDERQGLVRRLWRGQVPLRITFWIGGGLGNLLWRVPMAFAAAGGSDAVGLLVILLYWGYYGFIVVAIWRSAARYSGRKIWGDLARASLVLGMVATGARFLIPSLELPGFGGQ